MPRTADPDIERELTADLINTTTNIRHRRRWVEEQWLRGWRAWNALGLTRRFRTADSSKNDYDIPTARRTAEKSIARGVKLLTPNVKWFEVAPIGEVDDLKVANVDNFMWYVLRKRIRSKSLINQLTRSMYLYGRATIKTGIKRQNGYVWPFQRCVDPFSYYPFPETATDPDDMILCFEDFLVGYNQYNARAATMGIDLIDKNDLTAPDWPYHLVERLAHQGITTPQEEYATTQQRQAKVKEQLNKANPGFVALTECWITKEDRWYQSYIVWNLGKGPKITGFIGSDYDEPMYKTSIHRALPNESYTNSFMDDVNELQDLSNDTLNQFLDAVDFEQGIVAVDTSQQARQDRLKMKGRALWEFNGDPKEYINFIQPNISSTNQLRAWQIEMGLINSQGGAGTIAEGQPGRNMPRAGNAVNNLINLSLADIEGMAELIEQDCLTPGLGDIYKVSAEFIPEHQLIKIPGGQGLFDAILKKEDILGDFEFEWIGSLQFQDEAMRAQRGMIFLNMAPQLAPMLAQQGYALNMVELVNFIWRHSLGERGLRDIVVKMDQQQMMQPQQGGEGNTNGVAGLNYNLQNPVNGFVNQRG